VSQERAILKKKFSVREFVAEEWHKLKFSFRQLRTDCFRLYIYQLTKQGKESYTIGEWLDKRKIKQDMLKFIPYGVFIAVPVAEVLIPFYIGLFPNAIPSQFLNEKSVGKKKEKKEDQQKEAFECLYKKIKPFFASKFDEIDELKRQIKSDPFNKELCKRVTQLDSEISSELIEHWHKYQKKLKFSNLSIDEMNYVMKFLFFDFVSGGHIVNVLLNMHRKIYNAIVPRLLKNQQPIRLNRFIFDFFPLNTLRKYFLMMQLKRQLRKLDFEDRLVAKHAKSLQRLSSTEIYDFARERGIRVEHDVDRIEYYERVWLKDTSQIQKLDLRFWVMLIRFSYGKHLV
jgi:LETM1 and EF-hand domain-containing protein 1